MSGNAQATRRALDRLMIEVSRYGMLFVSSIVITVSKSLQCADSTFISLSSIPAISSENNQCPPENRFSFVKYTHHIYCSLCLHYCVRATAIISSVFRVWEGPVPTLALSGDQLGMVSSFKYPGSLIAPGGGVGKVKSRIAKIRAHFTNVRHFWCQWDIRLSLKVTANNSTVRCVLLYGCETAPYHFENIRRPFVCEH